MTKEAMPLINHEASHLRRRCPRAILWLAYRQSILSVYPGSRIAPSAHSASSPCGNGSAVPAMSMGCVLVVRGHSSRSNAGTTQRSIAQCVVILVRPPYFDAGNMQQASPLLFSGSVAEQQPFYSATCQAPGRYLSAVVIRCRIIRVDRCSLSFCSHVNHIWPGHATSSMKRRDACGAHWHT